jgi:hypothetical protein
MREAKATARTVTSVTRTCPRCAELEAEVKHLKRLLAEARVTKPVTSVTSVTNGGPKRDRAVYMRRYRARHREARP